MRNRCWACPLVILSGMIGLGVSGPVLAGPLDPRDFASQGTLVVDSGRVFAGENTLEVWEQDGTLVRSYEGVMHEGVLVFCRQGPGACRPGLALRGRPDRGLPRPQATELNVTDLVGPLSRGQRSMIF
jgi:hypothetical protein